ncbi:MAG: ATP synthase F0 subunit B [Nitrospirae bacterium]|nr:ATP synthase F0 subunit B [Nitrospirota bacterium]
MSKTTRTFIIATMAVILVTAAFHLVILAVLPAGLAHASVASEAAEEGAQHGSHLKEWFWLVVNFLILVGVLGFFLKKPIVEYFKQRTELLEKALSEAREAKVLAEKALSEIEQQLRLKDEEIKKIIEEATSAAEADRERLIAEGKDTSAAIARLTGENIDYELKKARDLIRQKAAEAAVELAADKIRKSMNDGIAGKLIGDSIVKIGQKMDAIN